MSTFCDYFLNTAASHRDRRYPGRMFQITSEASSLLPLPDSLPALRGFSPSALLRSGHTDRPAPTSTARPAAARFSWPQDWWACPKAPVPSLCPNVPFSVRLSFPIHLKSWPLPAHFSPSHTVGPAFVLSLSILPHKDESPPNGSLGACSSSMNIYFSY